MIDFFQIKCRVRKGGKPAIDCEKSPVVPVIFNHKKLREFALNLHR
jgi:hypothetical protein